MNAQTPVLVVVLAAIFSGCATSDPIDRLATRLAKEEMSGRFQQVKLPEAASPAEVVAKVLGGEVSYTILRIASVRLNGVVSPAVLVSTGNEKKIVLMHYVNDLGWWWSKVYDAK